MCSSYENEVLKLLLLELLLLLLLLWMGSDVIQRTQDGWWHRWWGWQMGTGRMETVFVCSPCQLNGCTIWGVVRGRAAGSLCALTSFLNVDSVTGVKAIPVRSVDVKFLRIFVYEILLLFRSTVNTGAICGVQQQKRAYKKKKQIEIKLGSHTKQFFTHPVADR